MPHALPYVIWIGWLHSAAAEQCTQKLAFRRGLKSKIRRKSAFQGLLAQQKRQWP